MEKLVKKFFFIILFLTVAITAGHTRFDPALVADALRMTSPNYRVDAAEVAPAVQAAKYLAHQLTLEPNPDIAKNIADTLMGLVGKGEGVGGLKTDRTANPTEAGWMVEALGTAAEFLATRDDYREDDLGRSFQDADTALGDGASEPHKTHLAIVATTTHTAFEKRRGHTDLAAIKAALIGAIPDASWLGRGVRNDTNWRYAPVILGRPNPTAFNAVISAEIARLAAAETTAADVAAGAGGDYTAYAAGLTTRTAGDGLQEATRVLRTTVIPAKAAALANGLMARLKTIDWSPMLTTPATLADAIAALIVVETYRMFETGDGALSTTDPTYFDYKGTGQDPPSEAVLLALVSAIQNYLYNPDATVEDLVRLFRYQKNSRELRIVREVPIVDAGGTAKPADQLQRERDAEEARAEARRAAVRAAATTLIGDGRIQQIINDGLLTQIRGTNLAIRRAQQLALDAVASRQKVMVYRIPQFDRGTQQQTLRPVQVIYYFGSSGAGLQCGFFSLGLANRDQALQQILDNSHEPEILALTDRNVVGGSANIKKTIDDAIRFSGKQTREIAEALLTERLDNEQKILRERQRTAWATEASKRQPYQVALAAMSEADIIAAVEIDRGKHEAASQKTAQELVDKFFFYLSLYAKKKGRKLEDIRKDQSDFRSFLTQFVSEYQALNEKVTESEAKITRAFEETTSPMREGGSATGKVIDTFNDRVSLLENKASHEKWLAQAQFVTFIYPDGDWREMVGESLTAKFRAGELEFDPNPDWLLKIATYPQILAILNGYNIYAWVSSAVFQRMQTEKGGHTTDPLQRSEDGNYFLINYLEGSEHGKPIGLVNMYGNHFEKWIDADDYSRLARAVRHQRRYSLPNTR